MAADVRRQAKRGVAEIQRRFGLQPVLAVVRVGRQAAASVYVQQILRRSDAAAPAHSIEHRHRHHPARLCRGRSAHPEAVRLRAGEVVGLF
jgi:5,10-methylene-tetrahydrofolate dehydrogenase/methenyl tetrahydrofolate cyclohydrolase